VAAPTVPVDRRSAAVGTGVLIALRIAYAYNWFDVGPGLLGVSAEFGVPAADWGILLASFLVGAGLGQVPAGLLARRYGPRRIALAGVLLLGLAGLAAAAAPTFGLLVAARGVGGVGAALFFSPAIGLVGDLQPASRRGLIVGVFSSAFSAGAALGVFASAILVPEIGWRGALALGGALLLAVTLVALPTVPRTAADAGGPPLSAPTRALRSRAVWSIGLAFIGLEGASLSAGQYFVPFAQTVHGWAPTVAGAVASLFVFPSFFGGPVGGALTQRSRRRRTQMVVATAIPGALLLLVPTADLAVAALTATIFSLSYGAVYAMMYVLAPFLPDIPANEVPLAIGLFNAIQIAGGAAITVLFAVLIDVAGYSTAWAALAVVTVAPLVLLLGVPATGPRPTPVVASGS